MLNYREKLEKCRYCKNYQHKDRNVTKPYKCVLAPYVCMENPNTLANYEKVDDMEARKKELNDYTKYLETRSKYIEIGSWIGIFITVTYFLSAAFLIAYGIVFWFNNDTMTFMQVIKYTITKHIILFWYVIIMTILSCIIVIRRD